jgi:hypothetical protein
VVFVVFVGSDFLVLVAFHQVVRAGNHPRVQKVNVRALDFFGSDSLNGQCYLV